MCIEAVSISARHTSGTWKSKSTMDICIAMWERVGIRTFTAGEIKDLITSPKQLVAMKNRGYLMKYTKASGTGKNYRGTVWQMTPAAMKLAEVEDKG
jgi:hypothetical protein